MGFSSKLLKNALNSVRVSGGPSLLNSTSTEQILDSFFANTDVGRRLAVERAPLMEEAYRMLLERTDAGRRYLKREEAERENFYEQVLAAAMRTEPYQEWLSDGIQQARERLQMQGVANYAPAEIEEAVHKMIWESSNFKMLVSDLLSGRFGAEDEAEPAQPAAPAPQPTAPIQHTLPFPPAETTGQAPAVPPVIVTGPAPQDTRSRRIANAAAAAVAAQQPETPEPVAEGGE